MWFEVTFCLGQTLTPDSTQYFFRILALFSNPFYDPETKLRNLNSNGNQNLQNSTLWSQCLDPLDDEEEAVLIDDGLCLLEVVGGLLGDGREVVGGLLDLLDAVVVNDVPDLLEAVVVDDVLGLISGLLEAILTVPLGGSPW